MINYLDYLMLWSTIVFIALILATASSTIH